jgi:hypothetical protein
MCGSVGEQTTGDRRARRPVDCELPFAGERLVSLTLAGNPKDFLEGPRSLGVPVSYGDLDLEIPAPVKLRSRGGGDSHFTIELVPQPPHSVLIEEAAVDFDGNEEEWREELMACSGKGSWEAELTWVIYIRLRLATAPAQATGPAGEGGT